MNLYHYTDLNAVHSILDTHKIRMTDIRYLNDKTEYLQGLEILQEASHEVFLQDSTYDEEFANVVDGWFKEAFQELLEFQNASEMFYVASFSRSSDTLSQWRSYGMFALELYEHKLQEKARSLKFEKTGPTGKYANIEFIECHYVNNKYDAIEEALKLIRTKVFPMMLDWWLPNVTEGINRHLYPDLKEVVSMLATTFKHAAFSEEQEVRLVISDEIVSKKICFRTKNNVLIPYYELDLPHEVFSGVVIGPVENQKITAQSLDIYNQHRANKLGGEKFQLSIETSDIPYRML
ncbi:DUF2971 domain-containing protein [Pantoea agglomerans]|uniref:DUF2971 domain-containing protein n=1 Tax=Enterobacter agglomerans TaxID=549 RepID=UPI00165477FA|nr:DUF2971 domain-containing protein [Pantoea agglomerans]